MKLLGNGQPSKRLFQVELAFRDGRLSKLKLEVGSPTIIMLGILQWFIRHLL
jgi:hypothetical protein